MNTTWHGTFRVMIVEDEIAIANLIQKLIDFDRLNLEFSGCAYSGQSAYEKIHKEKPDIVITDISLPIMNGLELIQKIQEENLSVSFIIVSGLTYFNYALSAIKMGVEDYLLKPVNKDELNNVLEKTILKIAQSMQLDYEIQKLNIDMHMQLLRQRRSFLMDLLYEKEHLAEYAEEQINQQYHFSFSPDTSFLIGISLIDGILKLDLSTQTKIIEQLMRSFQVSVKDLCIDMEVYNKSNQFLFVMNYEPCRESHILGAVEAAQSEMLERLSSYGNLALTIACGMPVGSVQKLSYSLSTAQKVINARILLGSQHILLAEELLKKNAHPRISPSTMGLNSIRSCIEIRDVQKLKGLLGELFKNTAAACRSCPCFLLDTFCDVCSALLADLYQHKFISKNLNDLYIQYCGAIEGYSDLKSLIQFTVNFLTDLLPIQENYSAQENRQIQSAKKYIEEHFNENLQLEDVAEQVYLAPTYFGVWFKKETGDSFNSYLTSVRMEKAKKLLQDIQYNISEIAGMVGYQDKRYFSRLFKKIVGVTPKEYRKIYSS